MNIKSLNSVADLQSQHKVSTSKETVNTTAFAELLKAELFSKMANGDSESSSFIEEALSDNETFKNLILKSGVAVGDSGWWNKASAVVEIAPQVPATFENENITFTSPISSSSDISNKSVFKTDKYDQYILDACKKYGVDPKVIKTIIKHESNFNPNAVSHAGAMGLMQLMPINVRGQNVKNPFDAAENIEAGVKLFKNYLDKNNGNLELTLASYNAGPGNVKKYGGVPPFKETQNYIRKIMSTLNSIE
jgi:hypothetical protein